MSVKKFVKSGLKIHGISVRKADIPYIKGMLLMVKQSEKALEAFPDLNGKVPFTIPDKEVITHDQP